MRYIIILFGTLLFTGISTAQVPDSISSREIRPEEAGIRQVLSDFINAWNVHDAKAFSMVFAEDADFTNVKGKGASGRGNIASFHAPVFATWFKDSHQTIVTTKIRFIRPDVAAVDAWWEMTGSTDPTGKPIALRKGLLNFIMTRSAEKWQISVMHNMDLPMPQ